MKKQSFTFLEKDEDFRKEVGSYPCFRVVDFSEVAPQGDRKLIDADQVITQRKEITIHFNYPLTTAADIKFKSKNGFSLRSFFRCVYQGYTKIYKEEGKDPGMFPGMLNRRPLNGKYGIWGHVIDDLYLEGARQVKPGKFELEIGS